MKKNLKTGVFYIICLMTLPALLGFVNYAGYPSDVIPFFNQWKITLGDGSTVTSLVAYENASYFYNANDGTDWVVYKTPNTGGTTANSSNTRSELRQLAEWTPETGGKLTGTLKVMNVSTTGDARVPATFSVVVGQIHSAEGNENEPIKIFYKKFPGQTKGSVYWNYEINTEGDNAERWEYSTAVWGNDWSVVGSSATTYPEEPADGIELGEEFSYEINVYNGIMDVKFTSNGHTTKTFTKSLVSSDFTSYSAIPQQALSVFSSTGQDGLEKTNAYAGENQYFKQGAYNQTNAKDPEENMIWNAGGSNNNGVLADQYDNGNYAEVWFKAATVGSGIANTTGGIEEKDAGNINVYPNPVVSNIQITSPIYPIISLQLFNLTGQHVINKSDMCENKIQLDLSTIGSGIYFLITKDALNCETVSKIRKQ